jgi:hypothetical protein
MVYRLAGFDSMSIDRAVAALNAGRAQSVL